MFDWGEKRPKQNFSSDFEVRTVEEAQPYKEYYIPASGLNPMQTIEYTNTANEKNNEWKAGKAFYNGFVVNAGRGILGTLAMLRDYNIASRPDVKPMAEGVAILDDALNSSVLQPYDVKGETELGQFGLDLTTGAGQLASQVLATILTGGAAGTAFMASNIAGNQYLDLRKDGVDVSTAAGASVTNALVQAPLERFSVGKILTKLPAGSPLKKKAKQIVETAVTEGITEFVQQYPEEITNYVAKNTGKSVEELVANADVGAWTKNAAYAGLLGAVLGGGAGSINVALQRNVNKQQQADFEEEIEVAKKSGAKADFIAALTDQQTNNDTVEIDAESIVTFAQENIGKVAENLGINAETIQKAAAEGTSIEITKGKLMQTELNVPGFYQAVKDDIDFTASGYTVNREKLQKELQKEYQIINKQEEELQIWKDEKLAEMRKAGMNKAEALDAITLLTSAARTARPDNPLQFLKEYPLVFERMVRTPKGSYPQYKQSAVNDNAFKKWFGDSKVVDEKGKPIVVYHGTGSDFEEFDIKRSGENYTYGKGAFFFTSKKSKAENYAALATGDFNNPGKVISAYLNINNPLVLKAPSAITAEDYYDMHTEMREEAERNGNDGIIIKSTNGDLYVVFNNKQIKSVDNQGTFSSDTANIYQQGERGQIGWDAEGKAIIGLFDTADASTFIHEAMGHYLANILAKEAAKPNANPQIIKDFETMLKYAGTTRERWEYLNSKRRYSNDYKQAAGPKAKTANIAKLEEAKKLEKSNASREDIYNKTGWYKGADGKWRFEIPDFLPKGNIRKFELPTSDMPMLEGTLSEVYPNNELYKAYPFLENIPVYVVNKKETYYGYAAGDYIVLNSNALGGLKDIESQDKASKTLIHEIQHLIQKYEDFARGGTEENVRILIDKQIKTLTEETKKFNSKVQKWWKLDQQAEEAFFSDISEEQANELQNKADAFAKENNISEAQQNEYRDVAYQIERLENALKEKDNFKLYQNLYGEVEARSASNKAELNDKIKKEKDKAVSYRYKANDAYIDLSENLKKIADEYKSVNQAIHNMTNETQNEEDYFDKSYELANELNKDETGEKFVAALDDMYWSLNTIQELEKDYVSAVLSDSADRLSNIYVFQSDIASKSDNRPSDMLTKAEDAELVRIQEAWATAAEQYFLEGKAPSKELQGAFRRFKNWLIDIYQTIQNFIATNQYAIPINDEVREVFDRMLASEYEIQQQERVNGYFSKLPSVITDNLSDKTKAQLQGYIDKAHDKAVDLLTKQSLVNFTAERKERIAEYRAEILPSVEEEIAQQPLYVASNMAIDMLNIKTARAAAQRYYDLLERSYDINKEPLSTKEETELNTFDMIAEETGYTSGDELAQAIMDNPSQSQAVKQRADELVQKKFPDIMKERELAEQQAREAIYNNDSGLVLAVELQLIEEQANEMLAKQRSAEQRAKLARSMRQNARNAAKEELANMVIGEAIKTRKYITAERNFAAKAAVAMSKKQYEEAQQYKRMQMFNHEMVQESIKIKQRVEGYQRYINRQRTAKKETWLNETHFNQAADLLARMGIVRKDYDPTTKTQTLAEYCNEMQELYDNVAIADWIIQDSKSLMSPNRNLTVDEYEDVVNALKNIKAIANSEKGLMAFGTNLDMREFFAEATENLSKLKTKYTPVVGERVKPSAIDQYKASLRSTDNFFEMMDGWKYGFFSKAFGESVKNATDNETTRVLDVQDATAKAYKEWLPTKEAALQAEQKMKYDTLGTSVDRHVLVKLLMNLGNESNARVLCSTPPNGLDNSPLWVKPNEEISQDEAILQTKNNLIEFLSSVLTEADVKYAQAKIDIANKYWQEMSDLERRWTGFTPKKVEAAPFTMVIAGKETVFKGGYFPLIRDSDLGSKPAAKDTVSDLDTQQGKNVRTLHTARGHFKERTQTSYPIDLKRGSEFKVMQDAIHDLCFREVVGDFRKLLNNQDMYALLKTKLGIADMQAFREYCEKVAQPYSTQNADVAENWIGSAAGWLRRKTVNAVIMLNLKTAIQNFGNILLYGNVADGFTHKDVLAGMGNYYMNMQTPEGYNSTKEFVYAKSSFMRERSDTPDITLRDLREENKLNPIEQKTMEWGTKLLVGTDNMTALPVWVQAYKKKLNAGATDKEAVNFADMIIRRTLGSSRITDVSPILRGGPLMKLLTTFQTFFNAQYNQWAREYNIFLRDKDATRLIQFVASKYIMACMLNLMLSFTDPFDDENDDGYMNITEELLKYPLGMLGPIGQAGTFVLQKAIDMKTYSYRLSPIQSTVEQTARAAATISGAIQGEKEVKDAVEAATGIAGIVYGVPAQINKLFFNAYDILFNGMDTQAQDLFKRRPVKER